MAAEHKPAGESSWQRLKALLALNALQMLILVGLTFLLAGIFVFGKKAAWENDNWADFSRTIGIGALSAAATMIVDRIFTAREFDVHIRRSVRAMQDYRPTS